MAEARQGRHAAVLLDEESLTTALPAVAAPTDAAKPTDAVKATDADADKAAGSGEATDAAKPDGEGPR